jgi:integrase
MKSSIKVLFWYRKTRANPLKGLITCRITVKGKDVNFSTGVHTERELWDATNGKVLGNTSAATHANKMLVKLRDELNDIHADLERQKRPVTAQRIADLYKSDGHSPLSLLGLYDAFLAEREKLVGVSISKPTHEAAKVRRNKMEKFLKAHNYLDLRPEEFTINFGDKLLHWLLLTEGFQRNTALKSLQMVSQILYWGVRREYLSKNPMELYEYKMSAPKDITFLTEEELEELSCFEFASETLGKARDFFVLQCWTGLAYADLYALDVASCVEVRHGRRVLRVQRAKSTTLKGYECIIPLLPEAERILAHYEDKPPVFTNQYYNRALKQIGMMCGLLEGKDMTSHIGRKTAGVLLLNTGIPMEVVSKILGHSSVRMTERVYAKILDRTVVDAIDKAFGALPAPGFEPEPEGIEEEPRVIQFRFGA